MAKNRTTIASWSEKEIFPVNSFSTWQSCPNPVRRTLCHEFTPLYVCRMVPLWSIPRRTEKIITQVTSVLAAQGRSSVKVIPKVARARWGLFGVKEEVSTLALSQLRARVTAIRAAQRWVPHNVSPPCSPIWRLAPTSMRTLGSGYHTWAMWQGGLLQNLNPMVLLLLDLPRPQTHGHVPWWVRVLSIRLLQKEA